MGTDDQSVRSKSDSDLDLALQVQLLRERLDTLDRYLQQFAPITPMYSLAQACHLIPVTESTLTHLLGRKRAHFDPPMYRHDKRHRRYRMLSHRDLLTARGFLLRTRVRTQLKADATALLAA